MERVVFVCFSVLCECGAELRCGGRDIGWGGCCYGERGTCADGCLATADEPHRRRGTREYGKPWHKRSGSARARPRRAISYVGGAVGVRHVSCRERVAARGVHRGVAVWRGVCARFGVSRSLQPRDLFRSPAVRCAHWTGLDRHTTHSSSLSNRQATTVTITSQQTSETASQASLSLHRSLRDSSDPRRFIVKVTAPMAWQTLALWHA